MAYAVGCEVHQRLSDDLRHSREHRHHTRNPRICRRALRVRLGNLEVTMSSHFKPGDRIVLEFNNGSEAHGTVVARGMHCSDDNTSVHYDDLDEVYNTRTARLRREGE